MMNHLFFFGYFSPKEDIPIGYDPWKWYIYLHLPTYNIKINHRRVISAWLLGWILVGKSSATTGIVDELKPLPATPNNHFLMDVWL